jgi:zinc D-Ala-D-Ala dipeptidase
MQKPYQSIAIQDCGEPLVAIPLSEFAIVEPHPYVAVGAPYGERSPFYLRSGILLRLRQAQRFLQDQRPGWRIQIFDAYRPVAVQQYMVDYSFAQECKARGLEPTALEEALAEQVWQAVYQFWAIPSLEPTMPPPHSTGAAVDVTLVDQSGTPVDMGSAIDEISALSFPQHFADAVDPRGAKAHELRSILFSAMEFAGFLGHPREWWHFSYGDQLWAWQINLKGNNVVPTIACYGYIES